MPCKIQWNDWFLRDKCFRNVDLLTINTLRHFSTSLHDRMESIVCQTWNIYQWCNCVLQVPSTSWCYRTADFGTHVTPAQTLAECRLFCCSDRQHILGFIIVSDWFITPLKSPFWKIISPPPIIHLSQLLGRWVDYARWIGVQ